MTQSTENSGELNEITYCEENLTNEVFKSILVSKCTGILNISTFLYRYEKMKTDTIDNNSEHVNTVDKAQRSLGQK